MSPRGASLTNSQASAVRSSSRSLHVSVSYEVWAKTWKRNLYNVQSISSPVNENSAGLVPTQAASYSDCFPENLPSLRYANRDFLGRSNPPAVLCEWWFRRASKIAVRWFCGGCSIYHGESLKHLSFHFQNFDRGRQNYEISRSFILDNWFNIKSPVKPSHSLFKLSWIRNQMANAALMPSSWIPTATPERSE